MRHLRAFLVEARTTAAHGVSELMLYSGERFVASADSGYAVLPLFDISVGEVKTKADLGQWREVLRSGEGFLASEGRRLVPDGVVVSLD
jgi:hypothetical protein